MKMANAKLAICDLHLLKDRYAGTFRNKGGVQGLPEDQMSGVRSRATIANLA